MGQKSKHSFGKIIHRNLLSIISLCVAIVALFYNTWRNEITENNRNIREAGFEILREAAYLQLLADQALYSKTSKPDFIEGWAKVNLIVSLSHVMPANVNSSAKNLKNSWQENWERAFLQEQANVKITDSIRQLDESVRQSLQGLR